VNLARNWSRLEAVAGRTTASPASLRGAATWGSTTRLPASRSTWAALTRYRGAYASRQSPQLADYGGAKRQLDLYAVWKRDARSRLRLSVSDLLHRNYRRLAAPMPDDEDLATSYVHRTRTVWRLVWEQSLL
jgi:hypothetical protein